MFLHLSAILFTVGGRGGFCLWVQGMSATGHPLETHTHIPPLEMAIQAGGTHPTRMHSCSMTFFNFYHLNQILLSCLSTGTQDNNVQRETNDRLCLVPCRHHLTSKGYSQRGSYNLSYIFRSITAVNIISGKFRGV